MIGRIVSHYRIDAELGRGGMGVVFRAYDLHLQRQVALKILTEKILSSGDTASAVLAEARAASALNHPAIITIYELGEQAGQHFLVMELLPGISMRTMLQQGRTDLRTVLRLGEQIAEALHAAHSEGIVHGDVKPENVMLLPNGRVKLLDFGIARRFSVSTQTMTLQTVDSCSHHFAGTLAYTAPEALQSSRIDGRADLYSLGVVLFELASGHRPFDASTPAALISQIVHQSPPDLKVSTHDRSSGIGRIIKRLLSKDPGERYQSAHEVQVELAVAEREFEIGPLVSSAVGDKRTVAVLPFRLLTPDPASEFLCVALADALINQLSMCSEIMVRPTSSVLRYAGRIMDPLLAARELNTDVCIEGSVQKLASKIRVHVQIWDAAERRSISSAKYDSMETELFQLQDSMSDRVRSVLGLPIASVADQLPPTDNPVAYELYLRAMDRLSRLNRWELRTAITMLEEATRLDGKFADAWARLADACLTMGTLFEPGEQWLGRAELAVRRCLNVDAGNADGCCAQGRLQWSPPNFQCRKALRSITRALRLNPGCKNAQIWNAMYLFHVGLHDDARRAASTALATNPQDPLAIMVIGHIATYSWDYDTAYKYHARALATDPSHLHAALQFPAVPLYVGDLHDAEEKIKLAGLIAPGDPLVSGWEALLFAKRGDAKKAEAAARRMARDKRQFTYSHHAAHAVAASYAIIGKTESALTWLRRASETGFPNYPVFRDDPHLTELRDVPEFRRFLTTLKRQWTAFAQEFAQSGSNAR